MAFILTEKNGVKFFRSDMIDCPHGFSTRIGGVSRAAHTATLNLAFGRGDGEPTVLENLRRFSGAVGIDPESVVSRPQIHSAEALYVDESNRGEGYYKKTPISSDGYVTDRPGVALGIKTADCVPILLYDPVSGFIGAVHAGWRGTVAGIAVNCVERMRFHGSDPENIRAAVGAGICFDCYEVGEDFYGSVESARGAGFAKEFIREKGGRLHADIIGMNAYLLREAGVWHIDISSHCTCHEPELFYSHRASGGLRGTMLSVISLPEAK